MENVSALTGCSLLIENSGGRTDLVLSRLRCEVLEQRWEGASRAAWALAGALLFKVCYIGLFRGEKQWCNAAYLAVAFASGGVGTLLKERAVTYKQLAELYTKAEPENADWTVLAELVTENGLKGQISRWW